MPRKPNSKPRAVITTFHVARVKELSLRGAFRPAIATVLGISYSAVRAIQRREGFAHPGFAEYLQMWHERACKRKGIVDGATLQPQQQES